MKKTTMTMKQAVNKVKRTVYDNRGKIVAGGMLVAGAAIRTMIDKKHEQEIENLQNQHERELDDVSYERHFKGWNTGMFYIGYKMALNKEPMYKDAGKMLLNDDSYIEGYGAGLREEEHETTGIEDGVTRTRMDILSRLEDEDDDMMTDDPDGEYETHEAGAF